MATSLLSKPDTMSLTSFTLSVSQADDKAVNPSAVKAYTCTNDKRDELLLAQVWQEDDSNMVT